MTGAFVVLTALLLGTAGAKDDPIKAEGSKDDPVRKELDRLQGEWALVAMNTNGVETKLTADGQDVAFRLKGKALDVSSGKQEYARYGKLEIDPAKKPRTMDVTTTEGGQQELAKCVYELNGDTLKVAYLRTQKPGAAEGLFADQRPTGFTMKPVDSTEMPHLRVLFLKRIKR
jgi:uncharacterized protein (TIGR03067 family)